MSSPLPKPNSDSRFEADLGAKAVHLGAPAPPALSTSKRLLDFAGALALGLALLPVLVLLAVLIRMDSPGPILFRQERVGLGGRRFSMLKFRSMYAGASDAAHRDYVVGLVNGRDDRAMAGGVFKLVDDPRVTPVGRWLRRTSLDELPQLWNVLRGDMSLVGPRPPLAYEVEQYGPLQLKRLLVRPGMTGLWQVSGRSLLSYRRMCELDAQYIDNWSLLGDLQILFRTIPAVLRNEGAAH